MKWRVSIIFLLLSIALPLPVHATAIPAEISGVWLLIQENVVNQTITINSDGATSGTYRDLGSDEQKGGVWVGRVERQCEIRRDLCTWYWTNGPTMLRLDFIGMEMTMQIRGYAQTYVRGLA